MEKLLEIIRGRKSVRTFDGNRLKAEDRENLEAYAARIVNPFGIPVRFVFLDAEENGLSSPVISGGTLYVAGIVEKLPCADAAFGFSFEKLVLYAWSLGIGTTWIGGTMKREIFEQAAGLADGERMPCVSPLGYPARKRSLRESMMRRGVGADTRMPAEKIFFDRKWDVPLSAAQKEKLGDLTEMVRWAPSAVNKQPWRIVCADGLYHFFVKHDKGFVSPQTGDLQITDVGIALCHFVMGLEEQGRHPEVVVCPPELSLPGDAEYIATVRDC